MPDRNVVPFGEGGTPRPYRRVPVTPELDRQEFQLGELLGLLWDSRWSIAGFVMVALLGAMLYTLFSTPVYRADALLEIRTEGTAANALTDSKSGGNEPGAVASQITLLRSRSVLGRVVDELNLDLVARPVYFPVLGQAVARWDGANAMLARERIEEFGVGGYAWGGEQIKVSEFSVPERFRGEPFTLVLRQGGGFELYDARERSLGTGKVGALTELPLGPGASVKITVDALEGIPGTRFQVLRQPLLAVINDLQQELQVNRQDEESGMVRLAMEGPDRDRIERIVDAVATTYRDQNIERSSLDLKKTLTFVEKQLPVVKERMREAQNRLERSQRKQGTVDLPLETRSVLERTVSLEAQLAELKRQRALFLQRYTPNHPEVATLNFQIETLEKQLQEAEHQAQGLPHTQQQILRLSREAEVSGNLYAQLMNRAQELRVRLAGPQGSVRVVDQAAASVEPVRPKPALTLVVAVALALILATATAVVRKIRNGSVEDPDALEAQFGLPVYTAVPASRHQRTLTRRKRVEAANPAVLAFAEPHDVAIEALRSLRTSLHVARANVQNKGLLITSPSMGAGKSFVSANLATVFAAAGKRVLLIDADMRTGALDAAFGMPPGWGLSDILSGVASGPRHVIFETAVDGLSLLPAGSVPPNPAELLIGNRFERLFEYLSEQFDEVIIDSPPVLAVTDAAVISHVVGTTVLVVKDGSTSVPEVDESVKRLEQAGANLRGVVFNGQRKSPPGYGYGYGAKYSPLVKAKAPNAGPGQ